MSSKVVAKAPKIKTTVVSMEDFEDLDFKSPSNYYIFLSTSEYLFIHGRDRAKCQQFVNDEFGGRYTIRAAKMGKASGMESAVGRQNTKSRMASKGPRG